MKEVTLPSGLVLRDPERTATRMMTEEWAYYDGVPNGDWNKIQPIDVLVTVSVNSFVNNAAKVRGVHRGLAASCDGLLGQIPLDKDLLSTELDVVEDLLHAACQVRDVLVPVATKVLHRKRSQLIPMLDNDVLKYYFKHLGRPGYLDDCQDKAKAASTATLALKVFKRDLAALDGDLGEIASRLSEARMSISKLRLLELLIWCTVESRGHYRDAVVE